MSGSSSTGVSRLTAISSGRRRTRSTTRPDTGRNRLPRANANMTRPAELALPVSSWTAMASASQTMDLGLRSARRMGHRHGEALLLRSLADLHRAEGRLAEAAEAFHRALPRVRGPQGRRTGTADPGRDLSRP